MTSEMDNTKNKDITQRIQLFLQQQPSIGKKLWDSLTYLRNLPIKQQKKEKSEARINRPVAVYQKPDRLREGEGIEFNIIFRSPGCSWAKSDSGGCTMCGYINDRAPENITPEHLWEQFEWAIQQHQEILNDSNKCIIFKMFTSGSFLDPKEFPIELQLKILKTLTTFASVKEIVVESRPEYIIDSTLLQYRKIIQQQYFEIGVGLESSNDFIRQNIINKGFTWAQFLTVKERLHQYTFGIKAYLLFKPPFLSEYMAIQDLITSIRDCINNKINTISINPTNIQMHTLCDELNQYNEFRPPWFFSLLWVIKNSITAHDLQEIRIISDPSAAGLERGIHNRLDHSPNLRELNRHYLEALKQFVLTQDLTVIPNFENDPCWDEYCLKLLLGSV